MKIAFDAKRLYNNFTGLGAYSRTLVRNLGCYFPGDDYLLFSPKASYNAETIFFRENYTTFTAPTYIPDSIWRTYSITGLLKENNVDIFHGLSHDMPAGIEKLNMGKVVTFHDVCYKTFPDMFPLIERKIYDKKYAHSAKVSDKIIAISQSTKNDVVNLLNVDPGKIEVIYQSINPIFYNQPLLDRSQDLVNRYGIKGDYALFVGTINSRKNLLGILKAYKALPESLRIPLVIIGSGGEYRKKCMEYAEKEGLLPLLVMLDSIESMVTLQAFYQCATFMIYPSFYEGFGLPVTEALLTGTPVITSNVSSLPEAGGPDSLYVDPNNIEDIANAIIKILDSKELRDKMSANGLLYASKTFDQELLTTKVHDLYTSLR